MTLNDYANEIMELVQRQLVDDFEIDIRLVKDLIIEQRLLEFNKFISGRKFNLPYSKLSKYAQSIDVPFVLSESTNEDASCNVINNKWLVSDNAEPFRFIDYFGAPAIFYTISATSRPLEFSNKINFVSSERALYVGNGRFNENQKLCFYNDGHVVITTKDNDFLTTNDREMFSIVGILEDPRDATGFDEDTDTFPIGPNWAYTQGFIIKKLLMKLQSPEDIINDGVDELKKE